MQCEKLFKEIEKTEDKYLDILEAACNIESPTNYKEGVDAVGKYFIDIAKSLGFKIEVLKQEISGDVVCITMNPDAKGKAISLSGHIDTVHPVGLFGTPAVKRDEINMYGPGVMDCKGGCVAGLMAMEALKKCGYIERPVRLLLQSDEENSSVTSNKETINYICKKANESEFFLNLEGIKGKTAVIQRKGILRYIITVHGKAMHSARCAEASNAITEAAYKIIELEKMKEADGLTCNCGVIHGGTVPNSVAAECRFSVDIRFSTNDELERARCIVDEITQRIFIEGCFSKAQEVSVRPAMVLSKKNTELLRKMNEIYEENRLPVLAGGRSLGGSDAAYITECGIPCVDSIGTEGEFIHSVKEHIRLDSLAESAKRIASVIYCF